MTNMTPRNTSESETGEMLERAPPVLPAEDELAASDGKSRRDAMAILAKHAAYTAPAVMAVLSLTTERATAGSGFGRGGGSGGSDDGGSDD